MGLGGAGVGGVEAGPSGDGMDVRTLARSFGRSLVCSRMSVPLHEKVSPANIFFKLIIFSKAASHHKPSIRSSPKQAFHLILFGIHFMQFVTIVK